MRQPTQVQGLVFGSLMAALVVVFALVPGLSLLMPIPLVLAYVRYGDRAAVLTAVVALIFTGMFRGPVTAFLTAPAVILGLVFGYGLRHRQKPLAIGLVAVMAYFVGFALQYVIMRTLLLGGQDPLVMGLESDLGQRWMALMMDSIRPLAEAPPDATANQLATAETYTKFLQDLERDPVAFMWRLLPGSLFMGALWSTWLTYTLCGLVLRRFGHEVPPLSPFGDLRIPTWVSLVYFLLLIPSSLIAGQSILEIPWWLTVTLNLASPLQLVLVVVGMGVGYGFMRRKAMPKAYAVFALLAVLLLLGAMGLQLFVMLAIIDSILDVRGLGHGWLSWTRQSP